MPEPRDHGPLPVLLIGLTLVTGLVDAFSYLELGHVFVANMTGNVVFLGFALTGVGGISLTATLAALAAFAVGAAVGGRWAATRSPHRGRLVAETAAGQGLLVLVAAVVAAAADIHATGPRLALIGLLAVPMGVQNAMVRRLAVPDLTTTVLTMTVTGLFADATPKQVRVRRAAGVVAMLAGAALGGALLRWVSVSAPLWAATAALLLCGAGAFAASRRPGAESWG